MKIPRLARARSNASLPMQETIDECLSSDAIVVTAITQLIVSKLESQGVANVAE